MLATRPNRVFCHTPKRKDRIVANEARGQRAIVVSCHDFYAIQELIANPPAPTKEAKDAMARHMAMFHNK